MCVLVGEAINEVTLVTHFTMERIHDFRKLCEAWSSHVSAVAYIKDDQLDDVCYILVLSHHYHY
jgi:hypothetical protein